MIQTKFGLNWPSGFRGEDFWKSLQTDDGHQVMAIAHTGELKRGMETTGPIGTKHSVHWFWPEDGTARQNFERGSPKDYFSKAWIHDWPSSLRGKQLKFHPPFLFLATVAMLVGCLNCRIQFWKGVIKGPKQGCKVLHVLSNPIKPICLGYFSEILFVEEYNICLRRTSFF
jgi:hypothetical protein